MSAAIPLWLKIAYGAGVPLIVVVYWRAYGPVNFLWLSDIALLSTAASVLLEIALPASMAAVGVLPLEIAWCIDFASRGRLLGLSAYMFDPKSPLYLRGISLFHLAIPPTLVYLLWRLGYDSRAPLAQGALTGLTLVTTYWLTDPAKNINWVFGPGSEPQYAIPPLIYLTIEMIAFVTLVLLPMHWVLHSLFHPA